MINQLGAAEGPQTGQTTVPMIPPVCPAFWFPLQPVVSNQNLINFIHILLNYVHFVQNKLLFSSENYSDGSFF